MTTGTWLLLAVAVLLVVTLAWAVWTLVRLLDDPQRRAGLAAAGRRTVAGYDWDVVARRVLAVYETVVPPGGAAVAASTEDDAALLGREPTGPFRRRVRR